MEDGRPARPAVASEIDGRRRPPSIELPAQDVAMLGGL